ncbi:hypothetical protein N9Y17_02765 [Gammaproteobacteria bacterium]|nr:hypothetical protein [Gammaproteobacteria bacterium]
MVHLKSKHPSLKDPTGAQQALNQLYQHLCLSAPPLQLQDRVITQFLNHMDNSVSNLIDRILNND